MKLNETGIKHRARNHPCTDKTHYRFFPYLAQGGDAFFQPIRPAMLRRSNMGCFEKVTDTEAVKIGHDIAEYLSDKEVTANDAIQILDALVMALRLSASIEVVMATNIKEKLR